jgi:hypothetical protein
MEDTKGLGKPATDWARNRRSVSTPDLRLLGYQLRDTLLERVGELSDGVDVDQLNKRVNP